MAETGDSGRSARPARAPRRWTRRAAIAGGGVAVLGGLGVAGLRKADQGGGHDGYFTAVGRALRAAGIAHPVLVIDRARLDANIAAARAALAPGRLPLRVVVKSLPAPALVDHVARGMGTSRLMVFNGAMLDAMAEAHPEADLLLGKPLPAMQFGQFLQARGPAAAARVQWLIDTPERLGQYAAVAAEARTPVRVAFEIDVGLHRGGLADADALARAVVQARAGGMLRPSGLMGYDPHVVKMVDPDRAYADAQARYRAAIDALGRATGADPRTLTLNSAGSPTYALHARGTVANEVAAGSAFVKPVDFDVPTLAAHVPASFIATPVIKAEPRFRLPGYEWLSGPMTFLDPNRRRAFFIYGGHWMATPVSPPGLEYDTLFGRSSNQELLTGSDRVRLAPDDYVFLRPNQSEALFLQFGDIVLFDRGRITERWPTLPVSA